MSKKEYETDSAKLYAEYEEHANECTALSLAGRKLTGEAKTKNVADLRELVKEKGDVFKKYLAAERIERAERRAKRQTRATA